MEIRTDTAASAYAETLATLGRATKVPSRLGHTREIMGFQLVITDPQWELIRCPTRRFNYRYMLAETMWHLQDRNDSGWLVKYNRGILDYLSDQEDILQVAWAYGPEVNPQLKSLMAMMRAYPGTRRAVITIPCRPANGMVMGTPPCPTVVQFLERNDQVHCFVYMRSNDAYMGLPYDLFMFMTWQQAVANALGKEVGVYHHYAASMHLYHYHEEKARQVWSEGCSRFSLDWRPSMDEVADGSLAAAMESIEAEEWEPGLCPSWHPGLCALQGEYENMDLALQELKRDGEGVNWSLGTGHAETPETAPADDGREEEGEAPSVLEGPEATS